MDEGKFKEKLESVKRVISEATPEAHPVLSSKTRQWVMHKLRNSNWKSADQLLKELLARLGPIRLLLFLTSRRFLMTTGATVTRTRTGRASKANVGSHPTTSWSTLVPRSFWPTEPLRLCWGSRPTKLSSGCGRRTSSKKCGIGQTCYMRLRWGSARGCGARLVSSSCFRYIRHIIQFDEDT